MQNIKISKVLDGAIARTLFQITKSQSHNSFAERLALELISSQGGMAYQMLSSSLEDWQLFQLRLRITSAINRNTEVESISAEQFFTNFSSQLLEMYADTDRVSTLHALHALVANYSGILSSSIALYSITEEHLKMEIDRIYNPRQILLDERILAQATSIIPNTTPSATQTKNHPLDKFGENLTSKAQRGELDPVIGRETEIERTIEILARRKKNNPILIGEAGVGKSAIIEGLAQRIIDNSVPANIRGKQLYSLDVSSLVAGTKFRGEFEERIQQLLETIQSSKDVIIFIDEIHTIMGAGSSQGSLDTANILKPALARGEVQTIGATTLDEFRQSIESDAALERRFQRVVVEPTTPEQSLEILRRLAPSYEQHHAVSYSEEALAACVELSHRYITDRHLPDKAIDLLDEAGAKVSISQSDSRVITPDTIRAVVSSSTGIPVDKISLAQRERLLKLTNHLKGRVIGQGGAIERLSASIIRSRTGLNDENRPIGVFMFVGPTGVGKTLLAKELSQWMFDSHSGLIRIDMSEYSEKHSVSRLIGSPPGYVGYGEGGQLSEAVRRHPYSVVLLDEIEKAHPEIFNTMLQIFDEGRLTDGSGRKIDFRTTIIIMTSNVGSQAPPKPRRQLGYTAQASAQAPQRDYTKALESRFSPEFLNRIDDTVIFSELALADIEQIVSLEIGAVQQRVGKLGYGLRITDAAKRQLAEMGYKAKYGARALRRTLIEHVEQPISNLILEGALDSGRTITIEKCRRMPNIRLKVA